MLRNIILALLAASCAAAVPASQPTKVQVTTVDAAEKPIAGVDVYLFHQIYPDKNDEQPVTFALGPIKSDAGGVAKIDIPCSDAKSVWTRTSVFARVPGKMIGGNIAHEPDKPLRVLMVPAMPMKGKVTVPDGLNPRDVKVTLLSLMVNEGTASSSSIYPGHDCWPELFEYPVAADGAFTVPEAPLQGGAYLAGNAKGLGEAQFMSMATGPAAGATLAAAEGRCHRGRRHARSRQCAAAPRRRRAAPRRRRM